MFGRALLVRGLDIPARQAALLFQARHVVGAYFVARRIFHLFKGTRDAVTHLKKQSGTFSIRKQKVISRRRNRTFQDTK